MHIMAPKGSNVDYEILSENEFDLDSTLEFLDGLRSGSRWSRLVRGEFGDFEHHQNSSLFDVYGHDYADVNARTMRFKEEVPGEYSGGADYRWKDDLNRALTYRRDQMQNSLSSAGDLSECGWGVFESVKGDYRVSVVDQKIQDARQVILDKFLGRLHEDEKLTKFDPITGKEAVTPIDPKTNKMYGIQYIYPFGLDDTNILHYSVLEAPPVDETEEVERSIPKLTSFLTCQDIMKFREPSQVGRIIGKILSVRPDLKKEGKQLFSQIQPIVNELNELYTTDGIEAIKSKLEGLGDVKGDISQKEIQTDIPLEVVWKVIAPRVLIRKASKNMADSLNRIRPPEKDGMGGPEWPKSKGGVYDIWITNDPLEVLTKTTGRAWGSKSQSCENWDGQYRQGPVSDIKYGNCVVYIYDGERNIEDPLENQIGRMMLRWGTGYTKEKQTGYDIGLEDQTYPKNARWGLDLATALVQILRDKGFMKYDYCMTPYEFQGYSDYEGRRGAITYSKPKFRGHGDIEFAEYDFIASARDPTLTFQRVGWLLTFGAETDGIYAALAQNPVLWVYPNPMRRFMRVLQNFPSSGDILHLLIDSPLADFNFFDYVLENIGDYDSDYRDYQYSIIPLILNHPNCSPEIHRKVRDQFPGFTTHRPPYSDIGGVDEIVYLNLMSSTNHFDLWTQPHICTAPEDVLDELVEKVLSGNLQNAKVRRMRYVPPSPIRYPDDYNITSEDVEFYWIHREYLTSIRNLMYAPSLSQKSFLRLLESFVKFFDGLDSDYSIKYPYSAVLIQRTIDDFIKCICLPLRESDDYGYTDVLETRANHDIVNSDPLYLRGYYRPPHYGEGIFVGLGEINEAFRYHLLERQCEDSVKMLHKITTTPFSIKNIDEESNLQFAGLLLNNIRSWEVYSLLVKNADGWSIPYSALLNVPCSRKHCNEPGNYVVGDSATFYNVMKKMVMETPEKLNDLRWDFTGGPLYDFKFSIYEEHPPSGTSRERTRLYPQVVSKLLHNSPQIVFDIGLNIFAQWIVEEGDFYVFENIVMNEVLDNETINNYLSLAAIGGPSLMGGLANNPKIPTPLVWRMILPTTSEEWGDRKWILNDDKAGGDYWEYIQFIFTQLASNPACDEPILNFILESVPANRTLIAQNPNCPSSLLLEARINNPLSILGNENLDSSFFEATVWHILNSLLEDPPVEPERFYDWAMGSTTGPEPLPPDTTRDWERWSYG